MNAHFPDFVAMQQNWISVQASDGSATEALAEIIRKYITADELLISINRKVGARLPIKEGIAFTAAHMGQSQIRISNREFTQFVLVASNCVATGTQIQANSSSSERAKNRVEAIYQEAAK